MQQNDWRTAEELARRVLAEHDDVAPLKAFVAAGLTPHQVAALYRRNVLTRPRKGWYANPLLPQEAVRAVRVGGALGGISSARSWGLPTPADPDALEVSVADDASHLRHSRDRTWQIAAGEEKGVRWIWARRLRAVRGWRVDVLDALVQIATTVPVDWFVAALDAALHVPRGGQALLGQQAWVDLQRALPRRLRRVCRLVDPRAESPIETLLRLAMLRAGLRPDLQVWVLPWYRADFVLDGWLVVEADGMWKIDDREQVALDRERDAQMSAWGYHVLRFTYRQITEEPEWVVGVIAATLAHRAAA